MRKVSEIGSDERYYLDTVMRSDAMNMTDSAIEALCTLWEQVYKSIGFTAENRLF
jgi:hypothetical protein